MLIATRRMEELAHKAREGDSSAHRELLRLLHPEVLRRCARFLPHRQDAEEACRDALARLGRELSRFERDSPFTTWLYTVVATSARHTYRSMRHRCAEDAAESTPWPQDPRTTSVIAGSRIGLLEALDEMERDRPDLVPPLVLRDLCQVDYGAIARGLGLGLDTVKSRIHEGRAYLRRSLAVAVVP